LTDHDLSRSSDAAGTGGKRAARRTAQPGAAKRRERSILPPAVSGAGEARLRRAKGSTGEGRESIPPHHDPACWGCGDNPDGIHLPQPETEGLDRYEAGVTFGEGHQAGPGIVHGGLVGAALDEACGLLATWYRFPAVTARIFVRYRRPVPINRRLALSSWVTGARGRRIHIAAQLHARDEVLAEARAAFLHVPLEHFLATPEGRAAGEAWRKRLQRDGD
jgi:acyl-coenzyme A thioesterase PaaI-like protein